MVLLGWGWQSGLVPWPPQDAVWLLTIVGVVGFGAGLGLLAYSLERTVAVASILIALGAAAAALGGLLLTSPCAWHTCTDAPLFPGLSFAVAGLAVLALGIYLLADRAWRVRKGRTLA